MDGVVTAERRLLVTRLDVPGDGALVLRRPVLVEAGQRYWLRDRSALVVEAASGERREYDGDWEWRCIGVKDELDE